jgi:predicted extracellular nuclease
MSRVLALGAIIGLLAVPGSAVAVGSSSLVVSEVYGGGGNASAPFTNDYVELRNIGGASVALAGWSIQYASASGTSWSVTALPAFTLGPGQFFLVQEASGGVNGAALPPPDATGTIALAATAGKVAVVSSTSALSGACPTGAVDLVGYGTATCFEGTAAAPAPSNTLSDQRKAHGQTDTDDNAADFATAAPDPQNSASPTAVRVRSFSARRHGSRGVVLRWRTGSEAATLGFNLYRGKRVLNRFPIAADGGLTGRAYTFRWAGPATRATFRLQAVRADGTRAWLAAASLE